jgi:hypothetical protein
MSNKQMKLYTEEQVRDAFKAGMSACMKHKDWALAINYPNKIELSEYMQSINSIELPSDEEIDRESEVLYPINKGGSMWMPSRYDIDKKNRQEGFLDGAKWMRDKIQGGNK